MIPPESLDAARLPRYGLHLVEHHHQGGQFGEEQWTTTSLKEEPHPDGPWVKYEDVAALLAEVARLRHENETLEQLFDAFDAGQEAALKGQPRDSNPHDPGDTFGVPVIWQMWDDGYICCSNLKLQQQVTDLTAALGQQMQESETRHE